MPSFVMVNGGPIMMFDTRVTEFDDPIPSKKVPSRTSGEPYVPPPRVRDAENYWPFMRCKNLAKKVIKNPSTNHFGLLQQLSTHYGLTVEEFKKTCPTKLLKNTPYVTPGDYRNPCFIPYHGGYRW